MEWVKTILSLLGGGKQQDAAIQADAQSQGTLSAMMKGIGGGDSMGAPQQVSQGGGQQPDGMETFKTFLNMFGKKGAPTEAPVLPKRTQTGDLGGTDANGFSSLFQNQA